MYIGEILFIVFLIFLVTLVLSGIFERSIEGKVIGGICIISLLSIIGMLGLWYNIQTTGKNSDKVAEYNVLEYECDNLSLYRTIDIYATIKLDDGSKTRYRISYTKDIDYIDELKKCIHKNDQNNSNKLIITNHYYTKYGITVPDFNEWFFKRSPRYSMHRTHEVYMPIEKIKQLPGYEVILAE